jgi:hypothetical protein
VQDEPRNRGGWNYMHELLRELLPDPAVLNYHGRDAAASPATGSHKMHEVESEEIICHALELPCTHIQVPMVPAPASVAADPARPQQSAAPAAAVAANKQSEEAKKS